jgi:Fe2+ transport system protein FeoA
MPGPDPKRRVTASKVQGSAGSVLVPIARSHLEKMGVDPDAEIEVDRRAYDTDRNAGEMGLRFYEVEDEE